MLLDKCLIWCIYLQDLQSEYNNFNEFDRAYIKSQNYRCYIYLYDLNYIMKFLRQSLT